MQTFALQQQSAAPIVRIPAEQMKAVPARCAELAVMPLSSLLYRVLITDGAASAF